MLRGTAVILWWTNECDWYFMLQQKWSQLTKIAPLYNLLDNIGFLILVTNDQKCWKTQSAKPIGLTPFWGSVSCYVNFNGTRDDICLGTGCLISFPGRGGLPTWCNYDTALRGVGRVGLALFVLPLVDDLVCIASEKWVVSYFIQVILGIVSTWTSSVT